MGIHHRARLSLRRDTGLRHRINKDIRLPIPRLRIFRRADSSNSLGNTVALARNRIINSLRLRRRLKTLMAVASPEIILLRRLRHTRTMYRLKTIQPRLRRALNRLNLAPNKILDLNLIMEINRALVPARRNTVQSPRRHLSVPLRRPE